MLHDDSWLWDRLVDGFVRQDVGTVQVKLVVHDHILPQHGHILHTNLTTQREVVITPVNNLNKYLHIQYEMRWRNKQYAYKQNKSINDIFQSLSLKDGSNYRNVPKLKKLRLESHGAQNSGW